MTEPAALQSRISYPANPLTPPDGTLCQQAARLFRTHGAVLLENSLEPELVRTLHHHFLHHYANLDRQEIQRTCLEVGAERYMFSVRLEPPFMDTRLYASWRVLPVVQQILGKDCVIQSVGVVCAYGGASLQHVHRDGFDLFPESSGLDTLFPPYAVTVVVPLIDLDQTTGTTALWDGSHRWKPEQCESPTSKEKLANLEGAELPWPKVGDCYLMDYRLVHAGTPNLSNAPRPILYLVYGRHWFQDHKNFDPQPPLIMSRKEHARIPQAHRQLFVNAVPQE